MLIAMFIALALAASVPGEVNPGAMLRVQRSAPGNLEVGGELVGLPFGTTRYLRYEDLLQLPQETYTVNDDSNLPRNTVIRGVALTTLARLFGQSPDSALIVAICSDGYRTNYPRDYLAAHHPLLVLQINGKARAEWPQSGNGGRFGPYLISHPFFKPAFKVLSHEDEPQIPYGVTRIEFRRESRVFGAIRPVGKWPGDSPVMQGYIIARQDCFRCHDMGAEGGSMASVNWVQMAAIARSDSRRFRQIIRNPASVTPTAKMPGQPGYDDATLDALTAYFQTFSEARAESRPEP